MAGQQRRGLEVLGIDVSHRLVERWRGWLAPDLQPFFVERSSARGIRAFPRDLSPELRDTYRAWKLSRRSLGVIWLDHDGFSALPRKERARLVRTQASIGRGAVPSVRAWADVLDPAELRDQADGHRFVWWPGLTGDAGTMRRVVEEGRSPCQRLSVDAATWRACSRVLPNVKALAGTFPPGSGPNCFGTVMAAAGVDGAAGTWMHTKPFERWLRTECRPGGDDDRAGTVMVWRGDDESPQHAVVTIGDGWALEKPSQEWSSPRAVLTVDQIIRNARTPGWHLSRHQLQRTGAPA